MNKIYLLRHCESVFNANPKEQIKDCPLTKKGELQASSIEGYYNLILCSPMKRTRQTLEYSKLTYDKLEINNIIREYKTDICDFLEDEKIIYETENEILNRVSYLKKFLSSVSGHKKILLISHADILWYLTSESLEREPYKTNEERFGIWLDNGEIRCIQSIISIC